MIDMNKKYQTKHGLPVRLLTTSGPSPWEVVGYIGDDTLPGAWTADGRFYSNVESKHDLIEVVEPVTIERWVNIYKGSAWYDPLLGLFRTESDANNSGSGRIACVKVAITYKPGDGLQ